MKSKYKAKKVNYEGMTFDSKGELKYYLKLKELESNGEISNLRTQVKYELVPRQTDENGKFKYHPISYKADFVFIQDGVEHIQDYKGFETPEFKIKKKLFYHKYNKDIEIVK